jgi:hypothetical protein
MTTLAKPGSNTLKRYTALSVAIDLLTEQRLTLLAPATWQDKNDIAFLEAYRAKREVANVFATCFTQAPETYHHWSVFASHNEGVRININKRLFLSSLRGKKGFLWNDVSYKTLDQLKALSKIDIYELPFLKRWAFRDEKEFRLLVECEDAAERFKSVELRREWVTSVTLSPWLPENLVISVKAALKSLPGCGKVRVQGTSLRDNEGWKSAADRVVHASASRGHPPQHF